MSKKLSRRIAEAVVEEIYPLAHNDARENLTAHFEPIIAAELPDGAEAASELLAMLEKCVQELRNYLDDETFYPTDAAVVEEEAIAIIAKYKNA